MKISPVKSYQQPGYPTRSEAQSNPDLLKHILPKAWLNEKMITGAIAAYLFCSPRIDTNAQTKTKTEIVPDSETKNQNSVNEEITKKDVFVAPLFRHGDGTGAWGCVIMSPPSYLSEEDARLIIEEELKKEGIIFDRKDVRMDEIIFQSKYKSSGYEFEEENDPEDNSGNLLVVVHPGSYYKNDDTLIVDGYSTVNNLVYEFVSAGDYTDLGGYKSGMSVQSFNTVEASENLREKFRSYGKINAVTFYDPMCPLPNEVINSFYSISSEQEPDYLASIEDAVKMREEALENPDDRKPDSDEGYRYPENKSSQSLLRQQVQEFIIWMKKQGALKEGRSPQDNTAGRSIIRDQHGFPLEAGEILNGEKEGLWIEYGELGRRAAEGTYLSGVKTGKWIFYDKTGRISEEGEYRNGLKEGLWTSCDWVKGISCAINYKGGKRHGSYKEESSFSGLLCEGEYVYGLKNGFWSETYFSNYLYHKNYGRGNYENGLREGHWTFYEDRIIKSEGNYSEGKKDGKWLFYQTDGSKTVCKYDDGLKTGYWIEPTIYSQDARGDYEDGKRDGLWEFFSEGQKIAEVNYENGIKSGKAYGYSLTGKKTWECNYIDNKIEGEKIVYGDDGQIAEEGSFRKGIKIGKWKYFNNERVPRREEGFDSNGKLNGLIIDWDYLGNKITEANYKSGLLEGTKIEYFRNGKIKSEAKYLNNKLEGSFIKYFKDGTKKSISNYNSGLLNGLLLEWYWNGVKKSEKIYVNGTLNGKSLEWHSNGKPKSECEYLRGEKHGLFAAWYKNGMKESESYYTNGEKSGHWTEWRYNGNKYSECDYSSQLNGRYTKWYLNGSKKTEGNYENGLETGKWTYWNIKGNLEAEGEFVNGLKHGVWKQYYNNGKLMCKGQYYNNNKTENWNYYKSNGIIQSSPVLNEGEFKEGKKSGSWTEWYENGSPKSEGDYIAGKKTGNWTYYSSNGEISHKCNYIDGFLNGHYEAWSWPNSSKNGIRTEGEYKAGSKENLWTTWDDKGQKILEVRYQEGKEISRNRNIEGSDAYEWSETHNMEND